MSSSVGGIGCCRSGKELVENAVGAKRCWVRENVSAGEGTKYESGEYWLQTLGVGRV